MSAHHWSLRTLPVNPRLLILLFALKIWLMRWVENSHCPSGIKKNVYPFDFIRQAHFERPFPFVLFINWPQLSSLHTFLTSPLSLNHPSLPYLLLQATPGHLASPNTSLHIVTSPPHLYSFLKVKFKCLSLNAFPTCLSMAHACVCYWLPTMCQPWFSVYRSIGEWKTLKSLGDFTPSNGGMIATSKQVDEQNYLLITRTEINKDWEVASCSIDWSGQRQPYS